MLSKIGFELDQIKKGYKDIEVLREWTKDMDAYIIFSAGGWRGGELCSNLCSSDFDDVIEVIHKRLEQRKAEALGYVKEIQEMLTEAENDKKGSR